ncbi:hypothetical protein PG997_003765 [Apiospora hydei]|uniref:Rhodopsin domain-containing protein n=1 Tax=Apiospora hydei TaxID=1337664 RepID=A0ABR1X0C8_9PEZI
MSGVRRSIRVLTPLKADIRLLDTVGRSPELYRRGNTPGGRWHHQHDKRLHIGVFADPDGAGPEAPVEAATHRPRSFSAGFLASIAGIVRVYFTAITVNDPNFDRTWNSWANWIASTVELGLGIICASIPAIKPFFAYYLPVVIETTRRRSHRQTAWVIKDEPEPQGSTSRWSYDDKSSPLPARLLPAFIKQHTRGASLQEVRVEPENELHLRPTFNSSNNKQQHKRSTSLQDTPSSSTVQPLSTFVHNRSASLQNPLSSPFSSATPIRPRPAAIGHKRGASLQDNNAQRPSLGDEPKTPVDVNKPLPSRDGVRYSGEETRLSSGPRDDRTTVLIMFKGDEEPQQPPHVPPI